MSAKTRIADITDSAAIATVIEGSGLFSGDEADAFIDTLPDLLADEDHLWLVSGSPVAGAAYLSLDGTSADVWNLWFIGVLPEMQRRGIGLALLTAAEAQARRRHGRLLLVETGSVEGFEAIRAFLHAADFAEVARIPDYFAPGDDKVVFSKTL